MMHPGRWIHAYLHQSISKHIFPTYTVESGQKIVPGHSQLDLKNLMSLNGHFFILSKLYCHIESWMLHSIAFPVNPFIKWDLLYTEMVLKYVSCEIVGNLITIWGCPHIDLFPIKENENDVRQTLSYNIYKLPF